MFDILVKFYWSHWLAINSRLCSNLFYSSYQKETHVHICECFQLQVKFVFSLVNKTFIE